MEPNKFIKEVYERMGQVSKDKSNNTIKYEDFINYGSENAVKEAGKLHVEGKNYIVEDGDVLFIRFNV